MQIKQPITLFLALCLLVLTLSSPVVQSVAAADSDDFVITVKTDNTGPSTDTQFTIPTAGMGYNYNVDCNDDGTDEATNLTGSYTCSYGAAGTYTIRISDNSGSGSGFPRIRFFNTGDRLKLLTIEQWGTGQWDSMLRAFYGCANLTLNATDSPNLSSVTDLAYMFTNATSFNGAIDGWNVSNIQNMSAMFQGATAFNQPLNNWVTSSVTNMSFMFNGATSFNENITGWDTSSVSAMNNMFTGATAFNQAIGGWVTSSVTNMSSMFYNASAFSQPLNGWNVGLVTNMNSMFRNADAFNQSLTSWDVSSVATMDSMFRDTALFNGDITGWLPGAGPYAVTNMSNMFWGASAFNQNINGWNVSSVTNMTYMFADANSFNQNLNSWNTGNVLNMSYMFRGNTAFNGNISNWNTSSVTNMTWMFALASAFNQNIGGWVTSSVQTMDGMFRAAPLFNQDVGSWDTGNVVTMQGMFLGATAFNRDIGGWNTGSLLNASTMFWNATSFDQNLGNWDVADVTNFTNMFLAATLSTANYDALLIGWNAQAIQSGRSFHGGSSKYCAGESARANMMYSDNWTIADGGKDCSAITPVAPSANGGNGPGGVGYTTGGGSGLELWLQADKGVFTDATCSTSASNGENVACWQDQSSNGYNYIQSTLGNQPNFYTSVLNNQPVLRFNGSSDRLNSGVVLAVGDATFTYFASWMSNTASGCHVVYEQNSATSAPGARAAFLQCSSAYGFNGQNNDFHNALPITVGNYYASTIIVNGMPSNNVAVYGNGAQATGSINMGTQNVGTTGGSAVGYKITTNSEFLDGDETEIIVYSDALNDVTRILVENYMSAKYDLPVITDVYNGDTNGNGDFDLDVAGIGQYGGNQHTQAHAAGMIVVDRSFLNDNGDWLLFGHNVAINANSSDDLPNTGDWLGKPNAQRWLRSFYIDVIDNTTGTNCSAPGTCFVDIIFDYSGGDMDGNPASLPGGAVSNYRLLKRTTIGDPFIDIATATAVVGDQVQFLGVDVSLLGSDFTLGSLDDSASPTAVTLQSFAAHSQSLNLVVVLVIGLFILGLAAIGLQRRRKSLS